MGSHRIGHNWATFNSIQFLKGHLKSLYSKESLFECENIPKSVFSAIIEVSSSKPIDLMYLEVSYFPYVRVLGKYCFSEQTVLRQVLNWIQLSYNLCVKNSTKLSLETTEAILIPCNDSRRQQEEEILAGTQLMKSYGFCSLQPSQLFPLYKNVLLPLLYGDFTWLVTVAIPLTGIVWWS